MGEAKAQRPQEGRQFSRETSQIPCSLRLWGAVPGRKSGVSPQRKRPQVKSSAKAERDRRSVEAEVPKGERRPIERLATAGSEKTLKRKSPWEYRGCLVDGNITDGQRTFTRSKALKAAEQIGDSLGGNGKRAREVERRTGCVKGESFGGWTPWVLVGWNKLARHSEEQTVKRVRNSEDGKVVGHGSQQPARETSVNRADKRTHYVDGAVGDGTPWKEPRGEREAEWGLRLCLGTVGSETKEVEAIVWKRRTWNWASSEEE